MASIKDAIEDSFQDDLCLVKYFVYTIPLYYCVYLYSTSKLSGMFWTAAVFTFMLLFGFMLICTSNTRNGKDSILPSYNIFALFFYSIKGLIALGPYILLTFWAATYITSQINIYIADPNVSLIFKIITWAVLSSVTLTGYLLYSQKFTISDTYNFKIISESCVDIMIRILFIIPAILVINGVFVGGITYLFWVFVGIPNPVCTFVWCMAFVINLAAIGNYMAQIDYESIGIKNETDDIIPTKSKE